MARLCSTAGFRRITVDSFDKGFLLTASGLIADVPCLLHAVLGLFTLQSLDVRTVAWVSSTCSRVALACQVSGGKCARNTKPYIHLGSMDLLH